MLRDRWGDGRGLNKRCQPSRFLEITERTEVYTKKGIPSEVRALGRPLWISCKQPVEKQSGSEPRTENNSFKFPSLRLSGCRSAGGQQYTGAAEGTPTAPTAGRVPLTAKPRPPVPTANGSRSGSGARPMGAGGQGALPFKERWDAQVLRTEPQECRIRWWSPLCPCR